MCENESVMLVDLGDAVIKGSSCLNCRVGTLAYMAPEMLSTPLPEDFFHAVLQNGMAEEDVPQYDEKVRYMGPFVTSRCLTTWQMKT